MKSPAYGRTWWGAQWLQALAQIDHDNRLPRGRTYANRGAVRDLSVAVSKIVARVQGSRPRPYDVEIAVPQSAPAQASRLLDRLADDPGLIARLLNRDLDPAVLQLAQQLKIPIFPARWSDLQMHCSCPDWAVPCKHLAAVIYLLSQQIDADPFLVFSLRGINLPALLKQRGVQLHEATQTALPTAAQALFGDDPPAVELGTESGAKPAAAGTGSDGSQPSPLARLDLTTLADLRQTLWRVLPANPVFHHGGDFRELAQAQMARVARLAVQTLQALASHEGVALPTGRLRLTVDDNAMVAVAGAQAAVEAGSGAGGELAVDASRVAMRTVADLFDALAAVSASQVADLAPEWAALWQLRLLALHLLAKGAVVPELMLLGPHTVALRWLPAEMDATVRSAVQHAATSLPAGLVQRRQGRKTSALAAAQQARLLLSLLLDHGVFAGVEPNAANGRTAAKPQLLDGKVAQLFFASGRGRFDGPGETAWPGSIQTWLARLHLARLAHAPVLLLDEARSGDGFALSLAVADEAQTLSEPTPLATVMKAAAWQARRMAVLQTVALLAEFHPPLAGYVRAGAQEPLPIKLSELPIFLFEALPAIRLLGIRALLPKSLDKLLRPRLAMQIKATAGASPAFLKAAQIFSFDWQVALGEATLTPKEFERLLGQASGVVRFKGEYVYLDPAAMEQLRQQLAKPPRMGAQDLLRVALAGSHAGAPVALNKAAQMLLEQLKSSAEIPLPLGLLATLRPYQVRGYEWLARNARLGLGSVIADDMGLGKTLQVIALLLHLKQRGDLDAGRALVIVPTSLLSNWHKEVARFAPALSVAIYHGSKRALAVGAARSDLLLTTYGVARSESTRLKALAWRIVVVDEAQNLKNPAAAQTQAVKAIQAAAYVAMSGTPVENRLSDYWSIIDFAQAGYLGGLTHFGREFATPIQTDRDAAAAARLKRVLAPFLLRRLKSDKTIINDLPDKIEQNQHCTLSKAQVALYETVVREGLASIAGESQTFQRQGLVLQMILALKQVCNHPAQYLKTSGTKHGDDDPLASGKVERLFDLLDEIEAAREKVLVFTQFREMGELLQRWLRERQGSGVLHSHGHEPQFLHGGVPRARRDKMVEGFQTEPAERVFLLSLKAGGTGLNLTAANHVIHFDLWWNPAVEAQATDRAYRIGQQRNVQVHRFITRGTFEERIDAMIRSKRELADMAVGTGETWVGQLPQHELKRLFELGPRG